MKARGAEGFTLVELLVALLLFEVGLLATAGTIFLAQESLARARKLQRGVVEAGRVADSLRARGFGGDGRRDFPGGEVEWEGKGGGEVAIVARAPAGGEPVIRLRVWLPEGEGEGP